MALSTGTLTGSIADLLGDEFDTRRTKIWLTTNVPGDTLIDTAGNQVRLGSGSVTLNSDGSFTATVWLPGADGNPTSWQTYVHVDYPDTGRRDRTRRTFGPFTVSASADLADLVAEQEVPPTYLSAVTAQLDTYVDDAAASASSASTSAAQAQAARDEAEALILEDLGTSDGQVAFLIDTPTSETAQRLTASTALVAGAHVSVKSAPYNATGDGVTDDRAAIQAAITAAATFGAAVFFPQGTYRLRSALSVSGTNIRLFGEGATLSRIVAYGEASAINALIVNNGDIDGFTVSDLGFEGTVVDDVTADPRHSRTTTSNGFGAALVLQGDLDPTGTHTVRDVRLTRVEISKCTGLPALLSGVRGDARIESCRSYLTMDWGFRWCETAIAVNCRAEKSADNGISLSRGCQKVIAVGNVVENAAYWGIWVAGFNVTGTADDHGPTDFTVTGNTIKTVGYGGICADEAPRRGVIAGNHIEDVRWGPTDELSSLRGVGVIVGGFPASDRVTPTAFAEDINIVGNTMVDLVRGGVLLAGCKNVNVSGNLIVRAGSQYESDGTTAIASTDTNNNFGVAVLTGAQSTVTRASILNNRIVDDRSTPYMNYAWYTTGSNSPVVYGNQESGSRQAANLIQDNTTQSHSGVHTYTANAKFTAGATAGANAASGTVAGWDINGAAGSARLNSFNTAGSRRWTVRASGDAESGSNAGSRFQISAYSDAGALIGHMFELTRDSKMGFFGATPVVKPSVGAAATDAATTQTLVNNLRTALINLGLVQS